MLKYNLAQVNTARMKAPLDSEIMAGFTAQIGVINAAADTSPGFVWRPSMPGGGHTYLTPYADHTILFNLSVWEDIEALKNYVYRSAHLAPMRQKQDWFTKMPGEHLALWWIASGELPTIAEAKERLEYLNAHGPTSHAFTFTTAFPPDLHGCHSL